MLLLRLSEFRIIISQINNKFCIEKDFRLKLNLNRSTNQYLHVFKLIFADRYPSRRDDSES